MSVPTLSVFFPCYNEVENVEALSRDTHALLARLGIDHEILIVDDGSRDGTGALAARLAEEIPQIRVVSHAVNQGYGAAVRSGLAAAHGDLVFFTDGDRQFDIEELPRLLDLLDDDVDLVAGYRLARQDPWHRKLNSGLYGLALRLAFGLDVRDVNCAFKVYRRKVFEGLTLRIDGALINAEIFLKVLARGARMKQVGVTHLPRTAGTQTGAKPAVVLRAMRQFLWLWWETKVRRD